MLVPTVGLSTAASLLLGRFLCGHSRLLRLLLLLGLVCVLGTLVAQCSRLQSSECWDDSRRALGLSRGASRSRYSADRCPRDAGESVEEVSRFLDQGSLAVTTTCLWRLEGQEDRSWEKMAEALGWPRATATPCSTPSQIGR